MNNGKMLSIAIADGCGRLGLPLGVAFACAGLSVELIAEDEDSAKTVRAGKFPFLEKTGADVLASVLKNGALRVSARGESSRSAEVFVLTIGTPVDEHLNPSLRSLLETLDVYKVEISAAKLLVFRGTLFPGATALIKNRLAPGNPNLAVTYCPERVAQGNALEEIGRFPQLVGSFDDAAFQLAYGLFSRVSPAVVRLTSLEAEVANLMHNAWRYLQFAIGNQFYMIAEENGADFHKIYRAISHNYPRASGYFSPGLTGGPALFDDTMQLASYYKHRFSFGHAAMLVNEGLPDLLVEKAQDAAGGSISGKKIGVLGLSYKAGSDDFRSSLSFKIKKRLEFCGAEVLFHDPYLAKAMPLETILNDSAAVILATPHEHYRDLKFRQPIIDVWNYYRRENLEVLPGRI